MTPLARIRRAIDREWIRVGWAGTQTLKHRLISLAPLLICSVPALILEPFSYGASVALILTGVCLTATLGLWIEKRRLAGTGHFLSKRSERVVRRWRQSQERFEDDRLSDL